MAKDWLRYDQMVEDALRGVVRRALTEAAMSGLPGDHHFYITFRTDTPIVRIPGHLKAQYPREMTIVLQHQFWDLTVADESFSVTLSFGGKHEPLHIPFNTIVSFADPSVKFALQFDSGEAENDDEILEGDEAEANEPTLALEKPAQADQRAATADKVAIGKTDGGKTDGGKTDGDKAADAAASASGATVVALDSFRKKQQ